MSVTQGYGLLLARRPSSSSISSWSPPLPLKIDGCSLGAVAGYAEQRTLLALATDAELREFCSSGGGDDEQNNGTNKKKKTLWGGKGGGRRKVGLELTLGLGSRLNQTKSVEQRQGGGGGTAASASAASSPAPTTTRAFTLSKGYIVDVSLRGLFVEPDADDMARAYGEGITAEDVLFGGGGGGGGGAGGDEGLVTSPPEAALLYRALKAAEEGGAASCAMTTKAW